VKFTHSFVTVGHYIIQMDDKWFKQRQKIVGVTAEQIAAAIKRDRSVVSRVYTGRQKMTLDLAEAFAQVLNVSLATVLEKAGVASSDPLTSTDPTFAKGDAAPYTPTNLESMKANAVADALKGSGNNTHLFKVYSKAMALAGILAGDLILVDKEKSERVQRGDVVLAKCFIKGGTSTTLLRRLEPPVLVAASVEPEDQRVYVVDGDNVTIVGKVIALWRSA
jgi:SOS-response transcriptional repressor LexA